MGRPGFVIDVTCNTVDEAHALAPSCEAVVREAIAKAQTEGSVAPEVEVVVTAED